MYGAEYMMTVGDLTGYVQGHMHGNVEEYTMGLATAAYTYPYPLAYTYPLLYINEFSLGVRDIIESVRTQTLMFDVEADVWVDEEACLPF